MYLYVLTAHNSFSVRLSVNLSNGLKDNPDGVIAIKKFLVHHRREVKNKGNINARGLWGIVRKEELQKAGKGYLGGTVGEGFVEEMAHQWDIER